jgi:hypothetical protein
MLFNTMSEMKLFLQDYAVYHHRPYTVRHFDNEVKFHVVCKAGFPCSWKLNARKRRSDWNWKVTSVEQPLVDKANDVLVSFL